MSNASHNVSAASIYACVHSTADGTTLHGVENAALFHQPLLGGVYLLEGLVFTLISLPICAAMYHRSLWKHNCYKMLAVISTVRLRGGQAATLSCFAV